MFLQVQGVPGQRVGFLNVVVMMVGEFHLLVEAQLAAMMIVEFHWYTATEVKFQLWVVSAMMGVEIYTMKMIVLEIVMKQAEFQTALVEFYLWMDFEQKVNLEVTLLKMDVVDLPLIGYKYFPVFLPSLS